MNPATLESLCLGLKGTTVDIKWGNDLCYLVGEKMYCVQSLEGDFKVSFKTTPEEYRVLTERNGIVPAPYVSRYHWVLVENPVALKPTEWKRLIQLSYQLVVDKLPRKVKP